MRVNAITLCNTLLLDFFFPPSLLYMFIQVTGNFTWDINGYKLFFGVFPHPTSGKGSSEKKKQTNKNR